MHICVPVKAPLDGPRPAGYNDWCDWAKRQREAGREQVVCGMCSRYIFPPEISRRRLVGIKMNADGARERFSSPVCVECDKKRV